MNVFVRVLYYLVAFAQFFAVWYGVKFLFSANSFISNAFSFIVAIFLTSIPILGSGVGVYGAVNAWDWSFAKSMMLFFWYVPVFIAFYGYSLISDRK